MTESQRKVLIAARKRIATRKDVRICMALGRLFISDECSEEDYTYLRRFIMNALYPSDTVETWLMEKGFIDEHWEPSQTKAYRLRWIDYMLEE